MPTRNASGEDAPRVEEPAFPGSGIGAVGLFRIQAAWTDQRSDPNAAADAGSSSAQSLQVAYDEVNEACESSGVSLLASRTLINGERKALTQLYRQSLSRPVAGP